MDYRGKRVVRKSDGTFELVEDTRTDEQRLSDQRKVTATVMLRRVAAEQALGVVRPGDTAAFVKRVKRQAEGRA